MFKKILKIVAAVLLITLIGWRLFPHSLSAVIPVGQDAVTHFSCTATVSVIKDEEAGFDIYKMDSLTSQDTCMREIWEILLSSDYRQDFRNALPWNIERTEPDKNYDGRAVNLIFSWGSGADESCLITFNSKSMIAVDKGVNSGFQIYHPTNPNLFDDLIKYLKLHGQEK